MKCDECQMLVQEYFDGELDPLTAAELSIHTESCWLCNAALEQLTLEQRIYQEYDRELDVSPALWMKVREQLAETDSRQNRTWFRRSPVNLSRLLSFPFRMAASATAVLLVFAVTGVVIKYLNRHETSKPLALSSDLVSQQLAPTPPNESVKPKRPGSRAEWSEIKRSIAVGSRPAHAGRPALRAYTRETAAPAQLVRKAEKQYLSAIALLTRDASQRQSQFDSATRAKLDGALAAIDRTILSTRKAVQRDPHDALAVQYMLAAYGKKVDVLKEIGSY